MYAKIFKYKPNYDMLRSFGYTLYPYLKDYNKHKFAYHFSKYKFISYSLSHKRYKCLHAEGQMYVARHVILMGSHFHMLQSLHFIVIQNLALTFHSLLLLNKYIIFLLYLSYQSFPMTTLII